MDKKTILIKTPEGVAEASGKGNVLSGDLKRALFLIDDKSTFEEISKRAAPSLRAALPEVLAQLLAGGYVRDSAAPQIVKPKAVNMPVNGELDFTAMPSAVQSKDRVVETADTRNALEAAVEAAKAKARMEAEAKAEANAKLAAETAAKDKAAAEARARQDAMARAQTEERLKQEAAARVRAEQVALQTRLQLEVAAQAKAAAEAEAARSKAEQVRMAEEAARAKAEADARAQAEERARQEAAALRLQAEQAAAQAKAEAEALARQQIEAARAQAEAAAKAKAEAEAARRQAEQEAARAKAELEAAKAQADAQAKAQAEERARQEAEAVRLKAEHEAARIKAEQDAAQARAEAALAEERAREQAEMARSQAEAEHLRVQAELEEMKAASLEQEKRAREQFAAGAAVDAAPRDAETATAARQADLIAQQRLADEQAKAWAAAEQRAKELAKAEAERPAPVATAEAPVKIAPPKQSRRRSPLPWGKIVAGLALAAVIGIVALPYVMPLERYIAPVEQALSGQFKQPVQVGKLQAAMFPWPTLRLEKVTLGKSQELSVDDVELTFDPLALFAEVKTIREVELRGVAVQAATLAKQWSWLQMVGADATHPVRHVTLSQVRIDGAEIALPLFGGEIMLDGVGAIERMRFNTADAKLDAELQGGQGRWQLVLNARENALPIFTDVVLEDFTAQGEVTVAGIDLTLFKAQAYGGFLEGKAKLGWQQGWQLQGNFEARGMELGKLFPTFGVTGELAGKARLSAAANKLGRLADSRQLGGSFVLIKGVINGIDMVETTRQGTHAASGGRTHLDELTGELQINGSTRHFGALQLSSGILSGTGAFDVVNGGQLAGRFSVSLKAGAGGASTLLLSGTPGKPVLRTGR